MNRNRINLNEQYLHRIIMESVNDVLNESYAVDEGIMDKFKRTRSTYEIEHYFYVNYDDVWISYDKDRDMFVYIDANADRHDTGISLGSENIGRNWNPFADSRFRKGNDITEEDYNRILAELKRWVAANKPRIDAEAQRGMGR